jgi:hypothetical protein
MMNMQNNFTSGGYKVDFVCLVDIVEMVDMVDTIDMVIIQKTFGYLKLVVDTSGWSRRTWCLVGMVEIVKNQPWWTAKINRVSMLEITDHFELIKLMELNWTQLYLIDLS